MANILFAVYEVEPIAKVIRTLREEDHDVTLVQDAPGAIAALDKRVYDAVIISTFLDTRSAQDHLTAMKKSCAGFVSYFVEEKLTAGFLFVYRVLQSQYNEQNVIIVTHYSTDLILEVIPNFCLANIIPWNKVEFDLSCYRAVLKIL